METRKVAVIGVGHVGAHVAYTLMMQGLVNEYFDNQTAKSN